MIQYIIAAGFGLWLGSQSKKSKKSYAHGGEVDYDEIIQSISEIRYDKLPPIKERTMSDKAYNKILNNATKDAIRTLYTIYNVDIYDLQKATKQKGGSYYKAFVDLYGENLKYAKGGVTEHGLQKGDTIIEDIFWKNKAVVKPKKGEKIIVDLDKGKRFADFAKGGKMQGYDDRLDESLSMRDGAGRKKQQGRKDRRDESAGMEKSMGRRKYASVGTMDKVKTLPKPAKDFIAYVIDMAGNTTLKYSKTFQGANRMMQNMLKKNQDVSTHGVSKYDPFYGTRVGKMFFEPIKGFAKGGMTEHGLEIGDKIVSEKDKEVLVYGGDKKFSKVNLDKGIRANFAKGGETNFIQQVVDSPDFRKGAFTKKAKSRDLTTEEFMKKVLKNPDKYDERTRKQAQFMKNITS